MALTTAQIQNAYVAFFNRPADVAGLTYWSTYAGSTADLLNTFAQSTEYKNLYSGLNNTQIVNAVYSNLFGHTPDVAGLTYWVTQLDQGKLAIGNIADAINKGAQGTDATIIANKTTAATEFTKALDTTAEIVAYAGVNSTGLDAVKAWLAAVTSDSATLTNATSTATLTSITTTVLNNVASTGSTFTLTANRTDNGTANVFSAPDIFNGPSGTYLQSLNTGDKLTGIGTNPTLNATLTGTPATPTMTGVETLNLTATAGTNLTLSASTGVKNINSVDSVAAPTVLGVAAALTSAGLTRTDNSLTITHANAALAGASDAITLNLNTAGSAAAQPIVTLQTATAASGYETVNIVTAGGASRLAQLTDGVSTSLATINVAGNQALRIDGALDATVKTLNAAAMTEGGSVRATLAAFAAGHAVTGSLGNDRITIQDLNANDVVGLAAGTGDTLAAAVNELGGLHVVLTTAGGGVAEKTFGKNGPHSLETFQNTINLNLIASFNISRLAAEHMSKNEPEDDERGVIINTASIAAFEGQIGQVAYTAAKAGIAGMCLTMARDLGPVGIRALAIAPSLFATGLTKGIPDEFAKALTKDAAFPKRLGKPEEFAKLVAAIVDNPMLNGQCIRLDAGQRFAPK